MCVVWWWKVLESRGRGGDAPQGSRRPRGGCHRGLGHMHCDSAGPWQASASCRLRKGCPGAMSSTRTIQSWRGAPRGHAVRVGCASVRPPSAMPRPPFLLTIFPYSGYTFKHLRARPCPQGWPTSGLRRAQYIVCFTTEGEKREILRSSPLPKIGSLFHKHPLQSTVVSSILRNSQNRLCGVCKVCRECATTKSATSMVASALITQTTWAVDCPALVLVQILLMGTATSAALPRSATGMAATAAIVRRTARRVLVVRIGGTVMATEIATRAASMSSATGTTATAEIFLEVVI